MQMFKAIVVFALVAVAVAKVEKRQASGFESISSFPQYSGLSAGRSLSPASYEGFGSSIFQGEGQLGQGVSSFYQPPVYPGAEVGAASYYGAQASPLSSRFGGGRSASSVYGQYDPLYSAVNSYSPYQRSAFGNRFGLDSGSQLGIPSTFGSEFAGQAYSPYTSAVYGGAGQAASYQPYATQETASYQPYAQAAESYQKK